MNGWNTGHQPRTGELLVARGGALAPGGGASSQKSCGRLDACMRVRDQGWRAGPVGGRPVVAPITEARPACRATVGILARPTPQRPDSSRFRHGSCRGNSVFFGGRSKQLGVSNLRSGLTNGAREPGISPLCNRQDRSVFLPGGSPTCGDAASRPRTIYPRRPTRAQSCPPNCRKCPGRRARSEQVGGGPIRVVALWAGLEVVTGRQAAPSLPLELAGQSW